MAKQKKETDLKMENVDAEMIGKFLAFLGIFNNRLTKFSEIFKKNQGYMVPYLSSMPKFKK